MHELRLFLVFALIFGIALQFHYYIVYEPLKTLESQPFISGITIDVVDLILLALYAHWAVLLSLGKGALRIRFGGGLSAVFLLWIAWCLFASLWKSKDLSYSFFEWVVMLKAFFLYFYLLNNTSNRKDFKVVVFALLASNVAHAFYMIMQYVSGQNYTLHGELVRGIRGGYEGFRAVGFFGSWDAASAMMAQVFPIGLAYFLATHKSAKRFAALVVTGVVLVGIFCAKVRASYMAVFVSSAAVLALAMVRGRVSRERVGRAMLGAALVLILLSPLVAYRFLYGTAGEERWPLVETATSMIKANWVLGVGLGNYPINITDYVPPALRGLWEYTVHNEYLLRMAETGIGGFLLYYTLVIMVTTRLWRGTRSDDWWINVISVGLFAAMIGSILPRLVSFYHYLNLFLQFAVIMAIAQAVETLGSQTAEQAADASPVSGRSGTAKAAALAHRVPGET